MPAFFKWGVNLLTLGCLYMLYLIFFGGETSFGLRLPQIETGQLESLKTVFISIFLEALPFILLGVVTSSFLQTFVSEETVRKLLPKNHWLGIGIASLLGIVLPLCECGMIPVVRRLIQKGMPVYLGITYILAAPIINPVTYISTFMAFRTQPEVALYRTLLAFIAVAAIGLILHRSVKEQPLRSAPAAPAARGREHRHDGNNRLAHAFSHASDEFFEMGKYLLLGAFLTAAIQTFVSRDTLLSLSWDGGGHLFMMAFAYLISLCSTSDAFIAASFTGTFPTGALLSFLVFGPMLDLKNTIMMLAVFRKKFVVRLSFLIFATVLVVTVLADWVGLV
ncbi:MULTISPECIES: permease [Cohnella]|uniref:permease n=1 Tax=Cohnella TaxID=329857 RepID=UPI001FE6DC41|nr:permease [Cohnella massiliensis]